MTEDDAFTMPTRAEMGVLMALWRHGSTPATGRDVIEHHDDCPAYPTVLNLLRPSAICTTKGSSDDGIVGLASSRSTISSL